MKACASAKVQSSDRLVAVRGETCSRHTLIKSLLTLYLQTRTHAHTHTTHTNTHTQHTQTHTHNTHTTHTQALAAVRGGTRGHHDKVDVTETHTHTTHTRRRWQLCVAGLVATMTRWTSRRHTHTHTTHTHTQHPHRRWRLCVAVLVATTTRWTSRRHTHIHAGVGSCAWRYSWPPRQGGRHGDTHTHTQHTHTKHTHTHTHTHAGVGSCAWRYSWPP